MSDPIFYFFNPIAPPLSRNLDAGVRLVLDRFEGKAVPVAEVVGAIRSHLGLPPYDTKLGHIQDNPPILASNPNDSAPGMISYRKGPKGIGEYFILICYRETSNLILPAHYRP